MDPRTDEELLTAWRRGERAAGAVLYDRHVAVVARFFRNKSPDAVEEMLQQTFLAVVEAHDRIPTDVPFRSYLLGIARHKLYDRLRRPQRTIDFDRESVSELAPGPLTIMVHKQEHRMLLEGLRRIPVEHQIALELSYWEGFNAAQIAEVFEISHSAMRSRLSKARSLLEQALTELTDSAVVLESTVHGLETWAREIRAKISPTLLKA